MKKSKYPIKEEELHKKKVNESILSHRIIDMFDCTQHGGGSLYHYTSPEGLKGILNSRTFYFTDCQFLNDYQERININDQLAKFWSNNSRNYDKRFVTVIKNIRVNDYEDCGFSYIDNDPDFNSSQSPERYFVFSTSIDPDSLSMWKYYAKNNAYDGYCLGVFSYATTDEWIDRETGVAIEEGYVVYGDNEKQNRIKNAVDKLYIKWCTYQISDELNTKINNEFKSWASIASLFFKNECFSSEKEYRFIAVVPTDLLNTLTYDYNGHKYKMYDFRIVNGVLTPYIKMPFNYWNVSDCWVIDSIRISPSMNFEQRKLGLELYINSLDYRMANYRIYKSDIPLRY